MCNKSCMNCNENKRFFCSFRKGGLLLNNVLGISGACLMGFTKVSHSYEMLFLGRFIIGVNCGN